MRHALSRRRLLQTAAGGLGCACAPMAALAQSDAPLSAETPADGLIWIRGAGGNVLAATDDRGVLLVDGGHASRAADLLDFVGLQTGGAPIHTLINTHWHPDQTGANLALGKAGADIVAHEYTRQWMAQDFWVRWQDVEYSAHPEAARPKTTFYDALDLPFGGEAANLGHMLQAHTDGDIYVRFPQQNVIASGGVGSVDGWPVLDWGTGGWIIGLMDGLDALIALSDDETKILPASGPVVTRAQLLEQRPMYETIQQRIYRMLREGLSVEEVILRRPAAEFEPRWGDPDAFLRLVYKGMVMQMRGHRMRIA